MIRHDVQDMVWWEKIEQYKKRNYVKKKYKAERNEKFDEDQIEQDSIWNNNKGSYRQDKTWHDMKNGTPYGRLD